VKIITRTRAICQGQEVGGHNFPVYQCFDTGPSLYLDDRAATETESSSDGPSMFERDTTPAWSIRSSRSERSYCSSI